VESEVAGRLRADLALGLLPVTEAAALACAAQLGRSDQGHVRDLAAAAMLQGLQELGVRVRVVLGPRGDHYLSHGTSVGADQMPVVDLGVYPVEGASLVARGLPNAISLVVAVEPDTFPQPPAVWYVEKMVAGPEARGAIDLDDPLADNLRRIAFARNARVSDLAVAVLDRPRHQDLMEEVRAAGARVMALEEGDIAGSLMAATEGTGVDAMVGIGGLQETVIAACAVRCLGGELQARLWPRNDQERMLAGEAAGRAFGVADLSPAAVVMAVTGISGGALLPAVSLGGGWAETSSLVLASQQASVRRVLSRHRRGPEPA